MASTVPPEHAQILVIGGGPGGSTTASALAREGFDVVLLEASEFPRYHIGESLIPSIPHVLKFIDADDKIRSYGFQKKPGAAMKFVQEKQPGYTDFLMLGEHNHSWNVVRSEFDDILLKHAISSGVKVFTSTKITSLGFDATSPNTDESNPLGRPVSATWIPNTPADSSSTPPEPRTITFDYLIDASGRAGIMSTKYLKNRRINENLKNLALWGYWTDVDRYSRNGDESLIAPWFEALTDESGWAWHIPLHNGTVSVGVVMDQKVLNQRKVDPSQISVLSAHLPPDPSPLILKYLYALEHHAPGLLELLKPGTMLQSSKAEARMGTNGVETVHGAVKTASDFSYSAPSYAGPGYRIVGDAGAFIDPWFSTGVHLAMMGGLSAAASVAASIRGETNEAEAAEFHTQRITISYTRLLVVVLSAYRQMRSQKADVLCDIGEDNFDKAFEAIRPLIQGNADMGPRVFDKEVRTALDFCSDMFSTTPEMKDEVRQMIRALAAEGEANTGGIKNEEVIADGVNGSKPDGLASSLWSWLKGGETTTAANATKAVFDIKAPVIPLDGLTDLAQRLHNASIDGKLPNISVEETRQVIANINARRVVHKEHDGLQGLQEEALAGFYARLERGNLGLTRCTA